MAKYRTDRVRGSRRYFIPRPGGNEDGRYNSPAYRKLRAELLLQFPVCQVRTHCRGAPSTQVYHKEPLRGPYDPRLTDRRNCLTSCQACNVGEAHSRKQG